MSERSYLKLNPKKTKLYQKVVQLTGHILTSEGVNIAKDKVKAVLEMPEPTLIANITDITWHGKLHTQIPAEPIYYYRTIESAYQG